MFACLKRTYLTNIYNFLIIFFFTVATKEAFFPNPFRLKIHRIKSDRWRARSRVQYVARCGLAEKRLFFLASVLRPAERFSIICRISISSISINISGVLFHRDIRALI